jgi:hypothetical protein
MGYLNLAGADWRRIRQALETGFTVQTLDTLVAQDFRRVHDEVPWVGEAKANIVFKVVEVANQHGVLDRLLVAASAVRPDRPDLRALLLHYSRQPGWAAPVLADGLDTRAALELLTTAGDPFFDTTRLARWLIDVERQVCVVRCGPRGVGTGFLVAADLVLTCHHVMLDYLKGEVGASDVRVLFDYRRPADGSEPLYDAGRWYGINPAWDVPQSPSSEADLTLEGDPDPAELDFALLRLDTPVGLDTPDGESTTRRWVDLSKDPRSPARSDPILIVQHPRRPGPPQYPPQSPLQISFATPGFEGENANGTRLVYNPGTLPGSSGSPVFDRTLGAVGLHHNNGELDPEAADRVKNNRGIPLARIRRALRDEVRALLVPPPRVP